MTILDDKTKESVDMMRATRKKRYPIIEMRICMECRLDFNKDIMQQSPYRKGYSVFCPVCLDKIEQSAIRKGLPKIKLEV